MAILREYHRPTTLDEALALLSRRDTRLVPLAGGTRLVGLLETRALPDVDGVVDLRDLALATIQQGPGWVQAGAMVTLSELAAHPRAGEVAGGLLRRAVRGEGPVNLRNVATVGGVVAAAEADSELYAALLALDAQVLFHALDGPTAQPLADWTGVSLGALVTGVRFGLDATHGGHARVARTPSDRPIVAALAVAGPQGVRVALCGVAARPVLAGTPLDPPDDYKGSAAYRRAMAEVVHARALAEIGATPA